MTWGRDDVLPVVRGQAEHVAHHLPPAGLALAVGAAHLRAGKENNSIKLVFVIYFGIFQVKLSYQEATRWPFLLDWNDNSSKFQREQANKWKFCLQMNKKGCLVTS